MGTSCQERPQAPPDQKGPSTRQHVAERHDQPVSDPPGQRSSEGGSLTDGPSRRQDPTRQAQPEGISRSRGPATSAVRGVEHVSGRVTSVSLIFGGLCPQTRV